MINFTAGAFHLYLQPRQDPQHPWLTTAFQLYEEELDLIVWDWPEEWKQHVTNDLLSIETDS